MITSIKGHFSKVKIISVVITLILLIAVGIRLKNFLYKSSYFDVEKIYAVNYPFLEKQNAKVFFIIRPKQNIFVIDVAKICREIERKYPHIESAKIRRVFPNRLVLYAKGRRPIAQIKTDGYYPVSIEGIILANLGDKKSNDLVTIYLNAKTTPSKEGEICKSPGLYKAFEIIDLISRDRILNMNKFSAIDAANPQNLTVFSDIGYEVRVGGADFKNRLKDLSIILSAEGFNPQNAKYIDLRFKDIIVGPR